jgi:hypothetical protein
MYGTTATYGTGHSDIFTDQVNNNYMVHSITYRYRWISYPVYSIYSIIIRRVDKCDITFWVKIAYCI